MPRLSAPILSIVMVDIVQEAGEFRPEDVRIGLPKEGVNWHSQKKTNYGSKETSRHDGKERKPDMWRE